MAKVVGKVIKGGGTATAKFAEADFSAFGYEPFPGTLNLEVSAEDKALLRSGQTVVGPTVDGYTDYLPCSVDGVSGHVHFAGGQRGIEVFAAVRLRDWLADGDQVTIRFEEQED